MVLGGDPQLAPAVAMGAGAVGGGGGETRHPEVEHVQASKTHSICHAQQVSSAVRINEGCSSARRRSTTERW